jgi:hypothetical protein
MGISALRLVRSGLQAPPSSPPLRDLFTECLFNARNYGVFLCMAGRETAVSQVTSAKSTQWSRIPFLASSLLMKLCLAGVDAEPLTVTQKRFLVKKVRRPGIACQGPSHRTTRHGDPPATPSKLFFKERAEHCGPFAFEVFFLLETLLKQSFDSLQRLRPG